VNEEDIHELMDDYEIDLTAAQRAAELIEQGMDEEEALGSGG
jgi:hypothetical protein